jgi:hypothetical protein
MADILQCCMANRNVYHSTYLYNFSFKPTNTLFGRITPAYNMPPTWCGPYQGVPDKGRSYKDTMMQISQNNYAFIFFYHGATAPMGPGLFIIEKS